MIAIVSDPHFGQKAFSKSMFESNMSFFEKQFFPFVLENDIKDVIIPGDLVDNRSMIDLFILQELKTRFFDWFEKNGVMAHILVGNHDSVYKNSIEYNFITTNTERYEFVRAYDKTTVEQIGKYLIGFVPWMAPDDDHKLPTKVDIVVGHFDIIGFEMMPNAISQEGFAQKDFKKYKLVLSGHYHIPSRKGNIQYIGSPYQMNWGDFGIQKGFFTLDDDYNLSFIGNDQCPKHLKLIYNDGIIICEGDGEPREVSYEESIELSKRHTIKFIAEKVSNQSACDTMYAKLQSVSKNNTRIDYVDNNSMIEDIDLEKLEDKIKEESDFLTTVSGFIESLKFDEGVDNKEIVNIFNELYNEVEEAR